MSDGADRLRQVRERIDNYRQTIFAIWALVSVCTWDKDSGKIGEGRRFAIGRRMTRVSSGVDITPDVVVQLTREVGLVAEAKRTLPADDGRWVAEIEQLRSYGEELSGWWNEGERIRVHDVGLLIHQFHGPRFLAFLKKQIEGGVVFRRNPCVIEFNVTEQIGQRMFLCLREGQLAIADLTQSLVDGVPVPMEKVLATYGERAFYDAEQEVEYLMERIWMDFVVGGTEGRVRGSGERHLEVPISAAAVTAGLQAGYGAKGGGRDGDYPKVSWVRGAMDRFVAIGLARKVSADQYVVLYRDIKGDLIERFVTAKARERKVRIPGRQRGRGQNGGQNLELF